MPTKPIDELFPPLDSNIKLTLKQFSALIDETMAFGTNVLDWHMKSAKGGNEVAPISLLFRHILELLGAVSSCVKNSNIDPCKILMRATLESFLGLAYLLKEDSVRRGFAFLAVEAHQRLKLVRMLDPSTPEGVRFQKALESDTVAPGYSHGISPELIKLSISRTEDFLNTPGVKSALDELRKVRKKNKNPNWYSLYGGPTSIAQLADYLGYQSLYLVFYKFWSRTTHGVDIIQGKLAMGSTGRPGIIQLRVPTDAQTMAQLAITVALRTFRLVVDKYCPEKKPQVTEWYEAEIMTRYLELGEHKFINVIIPT